MLRHCKKWRDWLNVMHLSESAIQSKCVTWFNNTYCLKHHTPRSMIFHVANENQHKHIALGVLAGVSDLVVLHGGQVLWVEMKDHKGRLRLAQIEFRERVCLMGYTYHVCRSLEEFKEIIESPA